METRNPKRYDLEGRTFEFAKRCRDFVNKLPKTTSNLVNGKQLIRSSGSVASNYVEANEALSKKDYFHRTKICRKEAKESRLWLRLCELKENKDLEKECQELVQEAFELTRIFGSIIERNK